MRSNASQYKYSLSQIFSSSLLNSFDDVNYQSEIKELLHASSLYPTETPWDIINAIDLTYEYLKQNYRCEYVYKNEIANQLLLKFHDDNSATLLKEVPSGSSIADLVIINGETNAYEIKTELDSFQRMPTQVEAYQALYDYVYIVTHPRAIESISKNINTDIGLIVFDNDGILKTVKKALLNSPRFNPDKAVLTLRQEELVEAYKQSLGKLPEIRTGLILEFCHNWYLKLPKMEAHRIFAQSLKDRKPSLEQFRLIKRTNHSLKMLFLGRKLSKRYCLSTINTLGL